MADEMPNGVAAAAEDDDEERNNSKNHSSDVSEKEILNEWGFQLEELYKLAQKFYKEKEGKALHLSYGEKIQLVARAQQVSHGAFDPSASSPVGYLDVIGRDRRQAWQGLSNMSRDDAMRGYVDILNSSCPLFRPYVQAHKTDLEERRRLLEEEEERRRQKELEDEEQRRLEEVARQQEELELRRLELQKLQIQQALNQQTCYQFKAYAQQQFPSSPEQQAILIRQLQEQHYQQYIQQVYQQQQQLEMRQPPDQMDGAAADGVDDDDDDHSRSSENEDDEEGGGDESEDCVNNQNQIPVKPASMWTRKDIADFKSAIEKEGGESIIKVGHGETVTVRVPTHEDGTCLFWEFATDNYDIGFGVYFEWVSSPGTQVSVHISESEEEADDEEDAKEDVERGGSSMPALDAHSQPPMTVIIPIYRRDCHEEVYAGSHAYPGQGVYLLKFDNSYSLWRSKTLYYRVYYTH